MNTTEPFRPAWWLPGGHLQTIFPALFRRPKPLAVDREELELPDGDFLALDWAAPPEGATDQTPLLLVLHGLEGSLRSQYVTGIMRAMRVEGWRTVLMNFRGTDGQPNRLARAYHSGETEDARHLIQVLRARYPQAPLALVGYSLGASVTLNYLSEERAAAPLMAAVAVSTPFDLAACAEHIHQGASRLYELRLMMALRRSLRLKLPLVAEPLGLTDAEVGSLWDFRSFDDRVTAPLFGFTGADDYYARASCRGKLGEIRVPTLIVQADDDPFMGAGATPEPQELPAQVQLERHASGGHLGFVAGERLLQPEYWLEQRLPAFFNQQLLIHQGKSPPEAGDEHHTKDN